MSLRATVLIPTHNHGPTLGYAARSVLDQSVADLELFIIGDGMNDQTRAVAQEVAESDPRVRLFDMSKGPRLGEVHRHAVLSSQARGRIVCYLSDDDLWLPTHIEEMERLLTAADFAHTLSVWVSPDGTLQAGNKLDLATPGIRARALADEPYTGGAPLSCFAHTLAIYRELPDGWNVTPVGMPTDVHMGRKFIAHAACRLATGTRPTLLRFPSPTRRDWTLEQRCQELAVWAGRVADPVWRSQFPGMVLDALVRADTAKYLDLKATRYQYRREAERWQQKVESERAAHAAELAKVRSSLDEMRGRLARLEEKLGRVAAKLEEARDGRARLAAELAEVRRADAEASRSWMGRARRLFGRAAQ